MNPSKSMYLVIFIASPSLFCALSLVSSREVGLQCADCRHNNALNYYRKTLPESYGFWCRLKQDEQKILVNRTGTNAYSSCMPELYSLSSDITDVCCFWGPEFGCGQLVGVRQQKLWKGRFPNTCDYCKDICFFEPQVQYCDDCKDFNEKHYSTWKPETTGYSCETPEDAAKVYKGKQWKRIPYKNKCVPPMYAIEGKIHTKCCFWSPKIGCGQLVGTTISKSCDCSGHCPSSANNYEFIHMLLALSIMNFALA